MFVHGQHRHPELWRRCASGACRETPGGELRWGPAGAQEHPVTRRTLAVRHSGPGRLLALRPRGRRTGRGRRRRSGAARQARVRGDSSSATVASCLSKVLVNGKGAVPASDHAGPGAKTPAQLKDAYKLTGPASGGRTVAIVDAYGYPNLERDLGDLPQPSSACPPARRPTAA